MKYFLIIFLSAWLLSGPLTGQIFKPYTLGLSTEKSLDESKNLISNTLQENGINVLGKYSPADDQNRYVLVVSSEELIAAVKKIGGLAGFALTQRIAITVENGETLISYTTPEYWANAYFRDQYESVASEIMSYKGKVEKSMKDAGEFKGEEFGSKKGIDAEDLHSYRYMMGMPRFDDTNELGEFTSYNEAVGKIENNLKKSIPDIALVYAIAIPDSKLKLYGIALKGENGESEFLPKIDISEPKHTAFLPYEMLVDDDEVHMLHGRYRIALSFPDLTMGTFTKIMSTPGNIEDLLESIVK